ncbi:MAG: OmpA family protein [Lachnospiraceae bacterium]|nr:OmpA family protein [Lachnospiraceae bacterium]
MKTRVLKGLLISGILLAAMGLSGCVGSNGGSKANASIEKPAVALMIANTANSKTIDFNAPIVADTITDCADKYGFVSFVRVDGKSEIVDNRSLDIEEKYKKASDSRLKIDARKRATEVLEDLKAIKAEYEEVDYLEGIRNAADSLGSLDESYTSKSIICCGTGFQTTGYLDFRNNLLSASPEAIVELLEEREALPDLSGITVYWMGMGQVAEPQEKLNPKQMKKLQSIWEAVIEASGGEFQPNKYISASAESDNKELPAVSVIDLPDEEPITFHEEIVESKNDTADDFLSEPVALTEERVKFIADKAEYSDESKVKKVLKPIAQFLNNNKNVNILLAGTTAGDNNDKTAISLSEMRAATVKNTLVELGVEDNRIITIGLGSGDPWHVYGAGYEGKIASENRKVVILDATSDDAKKILK